jgi:septal ring factor EnvC (AmiA/AmiB activator)
MVAIVVEAIKELAAKVDKLFEVKEDNNKNARAIASLEEQNAKLEAELAQMEAKLDEQDKKIEKILEKK